MRHRKIYSQSVTIKNRKERFAAAALEDGRQTEVQARLESLWPSLSEAARQTLVALVESLAAPTKTPRKR